MTRPHHVDVSHDVGSLTLDLPDSIPGWCEDIPVLRIFTCGVFTVEILQEVSQGKPTQARYAPLSPDRLRGRGAGPALTLLKLLISQPQRHAPKDWLMEHLREGEMSVTQKRMENVMSHLRGLLCLPNGNRLRDLVVYLRASQESGDSYRLAAFPLVWLDSDALTWNVQQAVLKERFGEDSLPYWERAYQLASRGQYLADEPYSEWAEARRDEVEDTIRQCVHALARCSLARYGEAAEEAVMQMLHTYWRVHRQDEDALRPLLELLCKRERYQEVLDHYTQLEAALAIQGPTKSGVSRTPHRLTGEIEAFAQLKLREGRQAERSPLTSFSAAAPSETRQASRPSATEPSPELWQAETRHLVGREDWLVTVTQMIHSSPPKKLLILHGPVGVGKSSELHRLASRWMQGTVMHGQVIPIAFPLVEPDTSPEMALDVFLGTLLTQCHHPPFQATVSRQMQSRSAIAALSTLSTPTLLLLDNAECLFGEQGQLAACWEDFLAHFLRSQHQAILLLATKEWSGWNGRDRLLVAECPVPPLTAQESVSLLQRLGLDMVPVDALSTISAAVSYLPLCLEWIAQLAHDPLLLAEWEDIEEVQGNDARRMTQRLLRLLDHPLLLETHLANKIQPLLRSVLETRLSQEARRVLECIAASTIPLGKPALQVLCPRPALLKELRDASLLAVSANRVQVLPIVASTIRSHATLHQRAEADAALIHALTCWIQEGTLDDHEAGSVIAEVTRLLLTHHRLLEAAQLFIRFGWRSFHLGYGPRLAHLAHTILHQVEWHDTDELECAGLVLIQILFPFLGQPIDPKKYVDYARIRCALLDHTMKLSAATEIYVIHLLLLDATNHARFDEAHALLDASRDALQQHTMLLGEWAFFFKAWSDAAEEQSKKQEAHHAREQAISFYRECVLHLSSRKETSPLEEDLRKKQVASCLNNLAYVLNILGKSEEALEAVEQSLVLKEQGYVYVGALAASYGEKAEILLELGRFQEALVFDQKAMAEIERCAETGDALSRGEVALYQVIRGRLSLRLGSVHEAERLFREALPAIDPKRRRYRMYAHDGLDEIEQWRQHAASSPHQLDWRWIERYRALCTYDSRWWLTWAGPWTQEEQTQWDQWRALPLDEANKTRLGTLMKTSRERELEAAFTAQREPRLQYPAIDRPEIRRRMDAQRTLHQEIAQQEPNAIVRRFYQDAIEEELDYLGLIEAVSEGDRERFWACNRRLFPLPTRENMAYAWTRVKQVVRQGLERPETAEISQQVREFVHTHLHLSLDLTPEEETLPEHSYTIPPPMETTTPPRLISAQAARSFFQNVLHESGYRDWQVTIDQNTMSARVEQAARCLYLPEKPFSLAEIKHLFIHEIAGHAARGMAGDRSLLGLLGIQTRNCQPTDEGLALYYEREAAARRGERFDDSGLRMGMLAVGLACGVMTPPQTFLSLFSFLECYASLLSLLRSPALHQEERERQARHYARLICLRVYRGVPHLEKPGVCYLQDVVHLHGLRLIEQAVAQDETVLDRLAVGKVAFASLPDIEELGLVAAPQPFQQRIFDPHLDTYIFSFT